MDIKLLWRNSVFMRIMPVGGINLWKHKHGSWLIRGWKRRRPLKITCTQNAQWAQAWNRDFQYTKKLWTKYVFELKKKRIYDPQRNVYMYSSSRHHRKGKLWPWCHSSPHFDGNWQTTYLAIMLLIGRSESIYKFYLKIDIE